MELPTGMLTYLIVGLAVVWLKSGTLKTKLMSERVSPVNACMRSQSHISKVYFAVMFLMS